MALRDALRRSVIHSTIAPTIAAKQTMHAPTSPRFVLALWSLIPLAFAPSTVLVAAEEERVPPGMEHHLAVKGVCAWPNLTLNTNGEVLAILHNQAAHGTQEGDIECWASADGVRWERRGLVTRHEPHTVRMNHAAGLAANGDFVVLCSGWTDVQQENRPKQPAFRDGVLRAWVLRSTDGGKTWTRRDEFPPSDSPQWTEHIPFGDIWAGEDGALHASTYQGKYVDASKSFKMNGWRSWHVRSNDDGWTWKVESIVGPRHNETNIFPLGENRWLAAARIERMELVRSEDAGKTWGKPEAVTGRNEINGHLNRLADGRLLLTYGVRVNGRRGVCAKLSSDEGKSWGEVLRLANAVGSADCGYPSSVQLHNGTIVTAWYASHSPLHDGYHMGVSVWQPPTTASQTSSFRHAGILDAWAAYGNRLTFGSGQTLALVDDGCNMSLPAWNVTMPDGRPKVRITHDAVDGDADPKHEGRGYHGSTIGIPSSVYHLDSRGVAYHNQVAVIRGNECCHCSIADSRQSLARALQWVLDHHREYQITTVNLAPVDDQQHATAVETEIDAKLKSLRAANIWVSAPTGNHKFQNGISWPACQPDCFAIGAVRPGTDVPYLDRHDKIALVVPAAATSSSNAIACGAAIVLREAIETAEYNWRRDGATLPAAMMAIFQRTGIEVQDPDVPGRTFRRLDLKRALDHVMAAVPTATLYEPTESADSLHVGVAERDITPPQGFPMAGYYHERLATGTIDPLLAKAIVFRQGDRAAALVVCDLIGISTDLSRAVRQRAAAETKIPVERIVIAATHTHTAPDYTKELWLHLGNAPQAALRKRYIEKLIDAQVAAIIAAFESARPCHLTAGAPQQETAVAFNRRFVMRDGSVKTWQKYSNPAVVRAAGPIDPQIGLVCIHDAKGDSPRAVLSNFALHLDTVGGTQWSADYPAYIDRTLKAAFGPQVVSIFGTGCCGDINHSDPSRVERNKVDFIGESLGKTITDNYGKLRPLDTPQLRVKSRVVQLPLQEATAEEVDRAVEIVGLAKRGEKVDFYDHVTAYKKLILDQIRHPQPHVTASDHITWGLSRSLAGVGDKLPVEVTTITLGPDLAIVCLPGEVFVELGLAIKRASPYRTTLIVELSNAVETIYVPHRTAYVGGSYEVTNSALQPGGGELLVEAAVALLRESASEAAREAAKQ